MSTFYEDQSRTGSSAAASKNGYEQYTEAIALEARRAVHAEQSACVTVRETLAAAHTTLRSLGADSEGFWFLGYVALSALVVVAEVATGIASAWLLSVPAGVRNLFIGTFIFFPPLTAIGLGEMLRPWRFRGHVGYQYRIGAILLILFAVAYLIATYRMRAASVALGGEDSLLPAGVEAVVLTLIAAGGYLLTIVGALTRESWQRFCLAREVGRLKRDLRMHETRLMRAQADLSRTTAFADNEHEPPSGSSSAAVREGGPSPSLTAAVVLLLVLCAPRVVGAATAPRCPEPARWLQAAIPPGARLALLITTQNLGEPQRALDRAMAKTVLACAGSGTLVTLRAVTATALTDAPVWQGIVPPDAPSDDPYASVRRRPFLNRGGEVIDRLFAGTSNGSYLRSNILGALQSSGRDWSTAGLGQRIVVIIASGWQQSRDMNFFAYGLRPADRIESTLRTLRRDGTLPDLTGTIVYLVGLSPGPPAMDATDAKINGLCALWSAIVSVANGKLNLCVGAFPGVEQPSP